MSPPGPEDRPDPGQVHAADVEAAAQRARLEPLWPAVHAVAGALLDGACLGRVDVLALIDAHPGPGPDGAER